MNPTDHYYEILGLSPGASPRQIKNTYRNLVKRWHPDHWGHDPALQQEAEEKLKEINEAYEFLKDYVPPPVASPQAARPRQPDPVSRPRPVRRESSTLLRTSDLRQRWFLVGALAAFYCWRWFSPLLFRSSAPRHPETQMKTDRPHPYFSIGSTQAQVIAAQGQPRRFGKDEIEYDNAIVYFNNGRVEKWSNKSDELAARLPDNVFLADAGSFTLGSSPREVFLVQGPPRAITNDEFDYGSSKVHFKNGRVSGWYDPLSKLKVALGSSSETAGPGYFTLGSTQEEVMDAQGSALDGYSDDALRYGLSRVYFQGGLVAGWDSVDPPLKAQILPGPGIVRQRYFTTGSSKDVVLALEGTPDGLTENEFRYGASYVHFSGGRVVGWESLSPRLKARDSSSLKTR